MTSVKKLSEIDKITISRNADDGEIDRDNAINEGPINEKYVKAKFTLNDECYDTKDNDFLCDTNLSDSIKPF